MARTWGQWTIEVSIAFVSLFFNFFEAHQLWYLVGYRAWIEEFPARRLNLGWRQKFCRVCGFKGQIMVGEVRKDGSKM